MQAIEVDQVARLLIVIMLTNGHDCRRLLVSGHRVGVADREKKNWKEEGGCRGKRTKNFCHRDQMPVDMLDQDDLVLIQKYL